MMNFWRAFGFGKKTREEYLAERSKVRLELVEIEGQRKSAEPQYQETQETLDYCNILLAILDDETKHPIARLAAAGQVGEFNQKIYSYTSLLVSAADGNVEAANDLVEIEQFARERIKEWDTRIKARKENVVDLVKLEKENSVKASQWRERREKAKKDLELAKARVAGLSNTVKANPTSDMWRQYYRERVATLKNKGIDLVARLCWTNTDDKTALTKEYFGYLGAMITGMNMIEHLEGIEYKIQKRIDDEIARLEWTHADLLGLPKPSAPSPDFLKPAPLPKNDDELQHSLG